MEIRCFVAVSLPPEIRGWLAELEGKLKEARADVGWVKPDNIHLTLKFLGEVEEERIPAVKGAIRQALEGAPSLSLSLSGLGVFPHPRAPRVIWVGIEGQRDELVMLQGMIEKSLEGIGFPREGRPFSPHVTLGRMRSRQGADALMDLVVHLGGTKGGMLQAHSVELFRSQLHPTGAVYSILESFPLRPVPSPP